MSDGQAVPGGVLFGESLKFLYIINRQIITSGVLIMGDTYKFRFIGALLECFIEFPLFRDDFDCLEANGYVKQVSPEQCEWLKSKTSLAEYFKWVGSEAGRITGGFWCPISRAFGMDKGQLQKLAGRNGNWCKPTESRDFVALKALVGRRKALRIRRERTAYHAIVKLVNGTKSDNPKKIHDVLQEIKKIFPKLWKK